MKYKQVNIKVIELINKNQSNEKKTNKKMDL